tara:strand:- start:73 stop:249 length:177 start_codon:yes stop_codon:yes gene_type:complete
MTKDVVKMIFEMENAVESNYPEIRSAASKALHSGKIMGFSINRPSKDKQERLTKLEKK